MFAKTDIYRYEVPSIGPFVADPLELRRRILMASSGRCWEWAKQVKEYEKMLANVGDAEGEKPAAERAEFSMRQAELEGHLAQIARSAFNLPEITVQNEQVIGVTELAALEVLYEFLAWLDQKKGQPGS